MKKLLLVLVLLFSCEKNDSVQPKEYLPSTNYIIYTCEQKSNDLAKAQEQLSCTPVNSQDYNIARTRVAYIESKPCY